MFILIILKWSTEMPAFEVFQLVMIAFGFSFIGDFPLSLGKWNEISKIWKESFVKIFEQSTAANSNQRFCHQTVFCFFFLIPWSVWCFACRQAVSALGTCSFRGVQKRAWDSLGLELEIAWATLSVLRTSPGPLEGQPVVLAAGHLLSTVVNWFVLYKCSCCEQLGALVTPVSW